MMKSLGNRGRVSCFVLGFAVILAPRVPMDTTPGAEAAKRLASRAAGATPMLDDVRELCDLIGGRPTGSRECERAIDWGATKFRAAGLGRVTAEPFNVPNFWQGERAEARCLFPAEFPIRLAAAPFSAGTPGGRELEAPLIDVGDGTSEAFAKLGTSARGAIALVHSREMKTLDDLFGEYLRNGPLIDGAQKAGVAALLLQSTRPDGVLYRHPVEADGSIAPVPVAIVSRDHAGRLARLLEKGEVRIRLLLANKTGGEYESKNVVAEIRGREKPDEVVLLGAHLDSWELGTGAEDNGVNVALVIDVARGFKELGLVPRRTVRFVLFTGEEQGMWGSAGYVRRHAAELNGHAAVVIFDIGSGHTSGFYLNGREELRKPVNDALSLVPGLEASGHNLEAVDGTDNFDFLLSGVPNLVALQDWAPYLPEYHAESDVFDRVNGGEAKSNEALAAELVWGLAESPSAPARRQTRAEVERLLRETKLDEQMKTYGQWNDWVAGKRGASR
jgi:carboxypeptidase Q